jgi:hypothetical protein
MAPNGEVAPAPARRVPRPGRDVALRVLGLVLTVLALWLVARSIDLATTASIIAKASIPPLVAIILVGATQLVIRSIRWRVLIRGGGADAQLPIRRVLPVLLIGYLGNVVLPARLGEPIRAYLLAVRENLSPTQTFGSVVLERVIDLTTLAIVGFVAAFALGTAAWLLQLTAVVAGIGIAALLILAHGAQPLIERLRSLTGNRAVIEPWLDRADRFAQGAGAVHGIGSIAVAGGISLTAWLLEVVSMWLAGAAIGVDLSLAVAMLIAAVAILGTAVPAAPGYVGTYELAAASAAGALGVPPAQALALAVVAHALTIIPPMIAGTVSLNILHEHLGSLASAAGTSGEVVPKPSG